MIGWIARTLLPAGALLAGLSLLGNPGAASDVETSKVFVGYVYGTPRDLNFRLYTHLCHAFLTADGEGKIRGTEGVPSRDLTSAAHVAGVRVLLSLGGWGWDAQFASIVSKPEDEERYIASVMEVIQNFDYDGIDIDWEYPDTQAEVAGFERLCRQFRNKLDTLGKTKGRPMLLTMAASSNPGTLKWLDTKQLLASMDWINVMTYDFAGDWTDEAGHHSPLFPRSKPPGNDRSTATTMSYLLEKRGLPADRLAVGIPLYGRAFAVSEPYASTKGTKKTRLPKGDYANLHRLLQEGGWTRRWDDETKNPWLIARDRSAVIGYDDPESVAEKTDWAMSKGFRGVFFWQVAEDRLPDGTNPLQEASRKHWERGLKTGNP
ncbi:MAG: glycoside hydrolase family 18 protein [Isosphaeraceae bacterium]